MPNMTPNGYLRIALLRCVGQRSLRRGVVRILAAAMLLGVVTPTAAQDLTALNKLEDDEDRADVFGAFADSFRLLLIEHASLLVTVDETRSRQ
jgi:hypothetical protein